MGASGNRNGELQNCTERETERESSHRRQYLDRTKNIRLHFYIYGIFYLGNCIFSILLPEAPTPGWRDDSCMYSRRQKNGDVFVPFRLNGNETPFHVLDDGKRRNIRPTLQTLASTNKTLEEFKKAKKSAVAVKRLQLEAVEVELAALARSIVDSLMRFQKSCDCRIHSKSNSGSSTVFQQSLEQGGGEKASILVD